MPLQAAEKIERTPDEASGPRKRPRLTEGGAYITLVAEPPFEEKLDKKDVAHFKLDALPSIVTRASYFVVCPGTPGFDDEPDKDVADLAGDLLATTSLSTDEPAARILLEKWNAQPSSSVPLGAPHVVIIMRWH